MDAITYPPEWLEGESLITPRVSNDVEHQKLTLGWLGRVGKGGTSSLEADRLSLRCPWGTPVGTASLQLGDSDQHSSGPQPWMRSPRREAAGEAGWTLRMRPRAFSCQMRGEPGATSEPRLWETPQNNRVSPTSVLTAKGKEGTVDLGIKKKILDILITVAIQTLFGSRFKQTIKSKNYETTGEIGALTGDWKTLKNYY